MGLIHRTFSNIANYINLNYIPPTGSNFKVKTKLSQINTHRGDNYVFGVYKGYSDNRSFTLNISEARQNFTYYVGGVFNDYAGSFSTGLTYDIEFSPSSFTVNGVTNSINSNYTTGTDRYFLIGAAGEQGTVDFSYLSEFAMEYFQIYEGDTLRFDLIPWKNSDGYGCLKDTLTGTIYNFTNPSEIEYISFFNPSKSVFNFRSTGGTDTFTLEADSNWTATTSSSWVHLNQTTGTTGGTITLTCDANSGTARTATYTFTNEGGDTFNLTINQKAQGIMVPQKKMKKSGRTIAKEYYNGVNN